MTFSFSSIADVQIESLAGMKEIITGRVIVEEDGRFSDYGIYYWTALISFVASGIMYNAGPVISPLIFKKYRTWSEEDKANCDSRLSSMFFTYICMHICYIILWQSDFYYEPGPVPFMLMTSRLTNAMFGISLGYFLVDFAACWKYHLGGNAMILHHIGSLTTVLAALWSQQCHYFGLWLLITEFTTPFINLRWWLEKEGLKSGRLYMYNGMAILISWTFARVMLFPPFFYSVWLQREQLPLIYPTSVFLLVVFPLILTFLNVFWYSKIVKGALKLVMGPAKAATKKTE